MGIERNRQVRDATARCLEAMVAYYNSGDANEAMGGMTLATRQAIVRCFAQGMTADDFLSRVLRPVESALGLRYGLAVGTDLFTRLLGASCRVVEGKIRLRSNLREYARSTEGDNPSGLAVLPRYVGGTATVREPW